MINTDVIYIQAPDFFDKHKVGLWNSLGRRNYKMQCFLYYTKIKKYPNAHSMKLMFMSENTFYRYKKEADQLWDIYFVNNK